MTKMNQITDPNDIFTRTDRKQIGELNGLGYDRIRMDQDYHISAFYTSQTTLMFRIKDLKPK